MANKRMVLVGSSLTLEARGQTLYSERKREDAMQDISGSNVGRLRMSVYPLAGSPKGHCNISVYDNTGAKFAENSGIVDCAVDIVASFGIDVSADGTSSVYPSGNGIYIDAAQDKFSNGRIEVELFGKLSDLMATAELYSSQGPYKLCNEGTVSGNGTLKLTLNFAILHV